MLNQKLRLILESLQYLGPEIILALLFLLIILFDLLLKEKSASVSPWIALAGLCFALFTVCFQSLQGISLGNGLFIGKVLVFKSLFLIAGILTVFLSEISTGFNQTKKGRGEYYAILVAIILGLHMMSMASNMLIMYLSIELVSIGSYVLAVYNFDRKSAEAGLKYILYGAFASGIMLFGFSLLYTLTGSLEFSGILNAMENAPSVLLLIASVMALGGLFFKIAAAPFHVWAPDVYEGAPVPVVAFFSVAPKAAGFSLLFSFFGVLYQGNVRTGSNIDYSLILGIVVMASLSIGNFSALLQNNIKRMLAYSSIAHAGFILTGLLAISHNGLNSVLFYLCIYLFMNFGAFIMVEILSDLTGSEDVRKFKGLGLKFPFIGAIFVLILISLTGLPPTAGFFAKFFVFSALWDAYQSSGNQILIIVFVFGILNTVISLFYYLKIPYYMYFKNGDHIVEKYPGKWAGILVSLVTVPLIVFFFRPDWLLNLINR
ncbi:MAG: NADH-quinone oxidoreductase subunit N [Cytophagaceae bacterium]